MNNLDKKEEFLKALGLTTVSAEKRAMESSSSNFSNNNNNNNNNSDTQCVHIDIPKRPVRKRNRTDGMKNHVFHLLTNEHIKRNKDAATVTFPKNKSTIVPNVTPVTLPTSIINNSPNRLNIKSSNLAPMQNNVVFLPQNQNQQGIVLGQTIFQSPDGKKFVLVPSSSTKQNCKPNLSVQQSPVNASLLPINGNMKINSGNDITTPSYVYLPTAKTSIASNIGSLTSATICSTFTNILPNNNLLTSPPKTLNISDVNHHSLKLNDLKQTSSTSNIMQLLNMTRSALNDAKLPMNSVNLSIWPQGANQTLKFMKIHKQPLSLASEMPVSKTSQGQILPLPGCVSVTPSGIKSPVLSTITNSDTSDVCDNSKVKQVIRISSLDAECTKKNVSKDSVDNFVVTNDHERIALPRNVSQVPVSSNYDLSIIEDTTVMNIDAATNIITTITSSASSYNGNNEMAAIESTEPYQDSPPYSSKDVVQIPHMINSKAPRKYTGDPKKNLTNTETNCVVIQGKPKKKRGKKKNPDNLQYRRYGGPPFTPCKAPPAPNTPSSSTCCLYEHTLLKMATRGFWGSEMGKLQDVFRSIRCESVDLDTVEDVTKRCYAFVRRKLLDSNDEQKAMYNYMRNYIDEFDSFLERVYPVAIIAIIIYLPTANDYSLVTWHGIPPTGWSEYRRAVVMREVFEVLYKFGQCNMVPEYDRTFFDNPVKCPLLVPRVFDLRKDFSDPTTCFVKKVPASNYSKDDEILPISSLAENNKDDTFNVEKNANQDGLMRNGDCQHDNESSNSSVSHEKNDNNCKNDEDKMKLDENGVVKIVSIDNQLIDSSSNNERNIKHPLLCINKDTTSDKPNTSFGSRMSPVYNERTISDSQDEGVFHQVIQTENGIIEAESEVAREILAQAACSKVGVITARFAESIAAACGNSKECRVSSSTCELADNSESNQSKRRASKRIASVSQRFDHYLQATDEVKLEKDLKKALKLSKIYSIPNTFVSTEIEKTHFEDDERSGRIALTARTNNMQFNKHVEEVEVSNSDQYTTDNNNTAIDSFPVLNHSVAFEALWTQQSIEEPIVVLHDNTSYKLGEYLEKFPIETHCPPASTQIIVCNEKYSAIEIFGYLRRGTQLVEQQGDDVVIDTTRTVKKNSVILAVRKVPPGKISKLVHPELHLETYTGFLLPIGMAQPAKSKRSAARSVKMKRKSIQYKEEVFVKEEPKSPLTNSPHHMIDNEDCFFGSPPRKVIRTDEEFLFNDEFVVNDNKIANKTNLVSAGTQTEGQLNVEDMNGNSMQNITKVEDLEQILNSALQNMISSCLISDMKNNDASSNCMKTLIESYERAGKFLLNTAKTLQTAHIIQNALHSKDSS